jgi:secondary thiamine-phosphate synthase enzyme
VQTISIKTNRRNEMVDVTERVSEFVRASGIQKGLAVIYVPHTTAGITINENADPSVVHDILLTLNQLVPPDQPGYRHNEGNSDAHVKAGLIGCSVTVIIENGSVKNLSHIFFW